MDLFKFAFMFLQAVNEGKNLFSVKIVVKEKDLQTVFRSLVFSQKNGSSVYLQCPQREVTALIAKFSRIAM